MIILNVKFPKTCNDCPCVHKEHPIHCQALSMNDNKTTYLVNIKSRHPKCPIINGFDNQRRII